MQRLYADLLDIMTLCSRSYRACKIHKLLHKYCAIPKVAKEAVSSDLSQSTASISQIQSQSLHDDSAGRSKALEVDVRSSICVPEASGFGIQLKAGKRGNHPSTRRGKRGGRLVQLQKRQRHRGQKPKGTPGNISKGAAQKCQQQCLYPDLLPGQVSFGVGGAALPGTIHSSSSCSSSSCSSSSSGGSTGKPVCNDSAEAETQAASQIKAQGKEQCKGHMLQPVVSFSVLPVGMHLSSLTSAAASAPTTFPTGPLPAGILPVGPGNALAVTVLVLRQQCARNGII